MYLKLARLYSALPNYKYGKKRQIAERDLNTNKNYSFKINLVYSINHQIKMMTRN